MATNTFEAFYLGVFSDLDPNEGNFQSENSSSLLGLTFGGSEAPLYDSIDSLTTNDANNDGAIAENDNGQAGENLIFGGVASTLDSVIEYNVTITYVDGTTATTRIVLLQDVSGRVFMAPFTAGSGFNPALGAKPIESMRLDSIAGDSYSGVYATTEQDAFIDGTVDGTAGNDNMGTSYTDADGTQMNAYGGDDTVDAGAGDDTIDSGGGNDLISGGSGADSISGGGGDDTIDGGAGDDTIGGGGGDDLIFGGDGNDSITDNGAFSEDTIDGGAGNDSIYAGGGNDLIYGGTGSDTIDGHDGDDTIYGGENPATSVGGSNAVGTSYTVIHLGSGGAIDDNEGNFGNENAGALLGSYGGAGNELYKTLQNAIVSDTNDNTRIDLDHDAAPETINIGGQDKLIDSAVVYNATVTFTDATSGIFTAVVIQTTDGEVYVMPELTDNADNTLLTSKPIQSISLDTVNTSFTNVTAARLDADYALPGDSDTSADVIDGGAGNDQIYGGAGRDTIDGGSGDDYMDGGDDEDSFIVEDGFGNDTIVGGEGGTDHDIIGLDNLTGPVTVTFTGEESGTITNGTDTISFSEIEEVIGTNQGNLFDLSGRTDNNSYVFSGGGDDTIIGGSGQDDLRGGDGNDSIEGGAGGGNLEGGAGNDTVTGGSGNEDIYGGTGDDSLSGGGGDDWFSAGSGADTVEGGAGDDDIDLQGDTDRDLVVFSDGDGNDTIYGFDLNDSGDGTTVDQFDLSGLTNAGGSPVNYYDAVITDTIGDGSGDAILSFPNGETITLVGIQPSQVDSQQQFFAMGISCFTAGTMIRTPTGEIAIEDLRPGDMVTTLEHGDQPVRWTACSEVAVEKAPLPDGVLPVRIKPGVMGNRRALLVSPQHCILLRIDDTSTPFYVRAKHLAEESHLASFARGRRCVTYAHVLLDQHATLISNDIPSESFYPGPMALKTMSALNRMTLFALLPDLAAKPVENAYGARALPILKRREVRKLIAESLLVRPRAMEVNPKPCQPNYGQAHASQA
ncbi:Hint domain-containing protein [Sulfitobacter sp. MF3-043]|uniref:Hint domain-containing protein n=1 Tax=Sulfitobacter sediminivivens TaxID=3252902 RepID=UPI0036D894EA